ncbi:HEAT repeat domain-containing protein [Nocardia lijiangensis]|uniref:HEAT repeat domain-containing protein n=1 Tax=Nocardia lijiangensis TaxID=299618 RepID=UPI003D727F33
MTATDDAAATKLLDEYKLAGGHGGTIPEIAETTTTSPKVIAVLSQWLTELEERWPGPETEGRALARWCLSDALGTKKARDTAAVPALISQFDITKTIGSQARWAAGNALYAIPAGVDYFDQLAAIATNRAFGADRQMIVSWLAKSHHPDAVAVALSQLDDDTVQGHALEVLSKLRAQGIRDRVEPFLSSKNKWHKRCAERILRYDES